MALFQKIKPYLIGILIPLAVGGLSTWASGSLGDNFYSTITVPPFAPPALLFPIVWSILYVLMGISSTLVYLKREKAPIAARDGLALYGASLIVNFFYSILLFRLRLFLFSSLWVLLLLVLVAAYMWKYARVFRPAAYLQIPYLIWTAFATYLTFAIYFLNK